METYRKAFAGVFERADSERAGAVYWQRGAYEKEAYRTTLSSFCEKG